MNDVDKMLKTRTFEEREEIYQLANWLQYKSLEDNDYRKYHFAIQDLISAFELLYPKRYYEEYFFPYIVVRGDRRRKGEDGIFSSSDWERLFPNDYNALLEKYKGELI